MANPDAPSLHVESLPLLVGGTPLQFTTNFRVWAVKPVFRAGPGNGFDILIGQLLPSGAVPSAIVREGAAGTQVNAVAIISPGEEWTPPSPRRWKGNGEQYQLKTFVVQADGGGVNQGVSVTRVRRGYGVTS